MSIASVASFFVGLKPFQPIWTIAGLWDVGWGGGDSAASDGHPMPGGGGRLEICLLPGERRSPGRITYGVGGRDMTCGEDKKRDGLQCRINI